MHFFFLTRQNLAQISFTLKNQDTVFTAIAFFPDFYLVGLHFGS